MSYKDPETQREYQRQWLRQRRDTFFAGKTCRLCGSSEALNLHHRDSTQKVSHRIWSWAEPRRLAELAKRDVLCDSCHRALHKHGTPERWDAGCRCARCSFDHWPRGYNAKRKEEIRSASFAGKVEAAGIEPAVCESPNDVTPARAEA